MSHPVRVLPSDVIAKIAAGEVIERPASVIKECVENSLDAGATSIEVHLKDAGKQFIHIKDNGSGITREDLENLFQRHATSKITAIDDLERLHSLGFRGEALFSIGSIADVIVTSATKNNQKTGQALNSPLGWELHVRGGKRLNFQPAATNSHGTEIKISELFFNTPARRKFLKSNTSELNQILDVFIPYTLLNPTVTFKLTHATRAIIDLKPAQSHCERFAKSLNIAADDLIFTEHDFKDDGIALAMVLGNINVQRTRRDLQYFFINGRPITHRSLGFHLNDIYRLILPPSMYSCFAIFMNIDPALIDVNIHPAKREVKISNEGRLISLIRHAVEHALMTRGDMRSVEIENQSLNPLPGLDAQGQGIAADHMIFGPGQSQGTFNPRRYFDQSQAMSPHRRPDDAISTSGENDQSLAILASEAQAHLFNKPVETLHDKFSRARFIGTFMRKYILWEVDDSLLLVDQHAAQERIMFERFKNQIDAGAVQVQHLLTPVVIKLSTQEKLTWEESQETLKEAGMDTTAFDDESIALQTVPVLVKNPESLLRSLLAKETSERCDHLTIARRACKTSIVTGDALNPEQIIHQRKELLACRDPFICPHGRPTVIEIKDSFLEKQFLRT